MHKLSISCNMDVEERVRQTFKELEIKASLDEPIEIDSLEWVELVLYLEEDFCISIPDEDIPSLKTIRDIIKYVKDNGLGQA